MRFLIPLIFAFCASARANDEEPASAPTADMSLNTEAIQSFPLDNLAIPNTSPVEDLEVHEAMVVDSILVATPFTDTPPVTVSHDQNSDEPVNNQDAPVSQTVYAVIGVCGMAGVGALVTGFLVWKHKTQAREGSVMHEKISIVGEKESMDSGRSADPALMELSIFGEKQSPAIVDLDQSSQQLEENRTSAFTPRSLSCASELGNERPNLNYPTEQVIEIVGSPPREWPESESSQCNSAVVISPNAVTEERTAMCFNNLHSDACSEASELHHDNHSMHEPQTISHQEAKTFMTQDIKKILQDSGSIDSRASQSPTNAKHRKAPRLSLLDTHHSTLRMYQITSENHTA